MSTAKPHGGYFANAESPKNSRIVLLDVAKGLAILLVILGHLVARDIKPAGNEWYEVANSYLYTFHMAFFFFLCGLIFFYKARLPASPSEYWINLKRRFWKVAPAYFLLAFVVYFGKFFAQKLFSVDRKVEFSLTEIFRLVTYPTESYESFLWFIIVLLLIEAIVPILFLIARNNNFFALFITSVVFFLPTSKFLAFHQVARYLFFFVLAAPFAENIPKLFYGARKRLVIWGVLFAGAILILPFSWLQFVLGIFGVFLLVGVSSIVPKSLVGFFGLLGRYTFVIYLLNTICIGSVKAGLFKFVSWNGYAFFVFLPILTIAGLLGPILVKQYIFSRIPWLDRITS